MTTKCFKRSDYFIPEDNIIEFSVLSTRVHLCFLLVHNVNLLSMNRFNRSFKIILLQEAGRICMTTKCFKRSDYFISEDNIIEFSDLSTHVHLLIMYIHVCFGSKFTVSVN